MFSGGWSARVISECTIGYECHSVPTMGEHVKGSWSITMLQTFFHNRARQMTGYEEKWVWSVCTILPAQPKSLVLFIPDYAASISF